MAEQFAHDVEQGLDFLDWLYPEGPWVLCAIPPEQDQIATRTFRPDTESECKAWIRNHSTWNIYYHVNQPTHDLNKKAERTDIERVHYFHVDVDPRVGEDVHAEQARIRELLTKKLPPGIPPPSAVVFSGGGFNALWRLAEPIEIGGDFQRAEETKRFNLQLEIQLGGDNCHDVSRILRLPGTINWPNEKKRRKGRTPCRSAVIVRTELVHPPSGFVAAQPVQPRGGKSGIGGISSGGSIPVQVSGNVARLHGTDDLGDKVSARCKMIIVQGLDPDEPNKFGNSRSEWLNYVCCELVRSGVTDEVIYSVITDPSFLISASVLDKGSQTERYALRQIQRAREQAVDEKLPTLNDKHAVIGNINGQCRIIEEILDYTFDTPRERLTIQSFEDFRNRYMNQSVEIGRSTKGEVKYMPLGEWWLRSPSRRQYETIVFAPGREVTGAYNLWRGFACEARHGNRHESFLKHVLDNVCCGVQDHYDYLVKWMARAVQHPNAQGEVAVVFRGDQGTGKGFTAREFSKLWGRHAIQVTDPKHLVGNFNAHLRDAVVVFADEAFYAGDKKHESILKGLVTEELLIIEGKGKDALTSRNFVHLMMASNAAWVVPAGTNERRYFVLDVGAAQMQNHDYFETISADLAAGGRENLLYHLLTMKLDGFNVRVFPHTEALREQKMLSMSAEHEWWYQKLMEGRLLNRHVSWTAPVFRQDLLEDYLDYANRLRVLRPANATALGKFIQGMAPGAEWPRSRQHTRVYHNKEGIRMNQRAWAYEFPTLQDCRAHWDSKFSGNAPWPREEAPNGDEQIDAF